MADAGGGAILEQRANIFLIFRPDFHLRSLSFIGKTSSRRKFELLNELHPNIGNVYNTVVFN